MNWTELISEIPAVGSAGTSTTPIAGIEYDSRRVRPGSVFVAMKGASTDGNKFVSKAIASGAVAIVTDSAETFDHLTVYAPQVAVLEVEHGRRALAQASAAFFAHPEKKLASTGITGTNGKTTTAFLIESLLNSAHRKTILIGTIENHVAGETRPSVHTTPESRDIFELLAEGASRGATELVAEVSSHALDQGRMSGIPFDVAVFTNLTRDHLDYHQTMEKYFSAKKLLFDGARYPAPRVAVLNAQDPYTRRLSAAASKTGAEIHTYGINQGDWRAVHPTLHPAGATFSLVTPYGVAEVTSRLAGEVNILNLLAASAAAHARGLSFTEIVAAIPNLHPVSGRFQPVHAGQPFAVIVDYAHTDDALRNLIALARQMLQSSATDPGEIVQSGATELGAPGLASETWDRDNAVNAPAVGAPGPSPLGTGDHNHPAPQKSPTPRIVTLFGCGGDRDRAKRPKMAQAAGESSDLVIATSDNPRSEDPLAILAEIEPALRATGVPYKIEPDRAAAIRLAIQSAAPGDIVLLAGKGHEKEQILSTGPIPFDDIEVARTALAELGWPSLEPPS